MTRPTSVNFTAATRMLALKRGNNACECIDCGRTKRWLLLIGDCAVVEVAVPAHWFREAALGISRYRMDQLRDALTIAKRRYPKAAGRLLKAYFNGSNTLEVDHLVEVQEGGGAELRNAVVRCVVCHRDKTLTRGNALRKGPKAKSYGSQTIAQSA